MQAADQIGAVLAIVVGASLALSVALGSLLSYLTESVKRTGLVPTGYGGLLALGISMLLGVTLAALTALMTDTGYGFGTMLLLGAFAGAVMAAGAVKEYQASADLNTAPAWQGGFASGQQAALAAAQPQQDPEVAEAVNLLRSLKAEHAREQARHPDEPPSSQQRPRAGPQRA